MTVSIDPASVPSQLGLNCTVARDSSGVPVPEHEDEKFVQQATPVEVVFGDGVSAGPGLLYITSNRLLWVASQQQMAVAIRYQQIVMHAISRDPEGQSKACIYVQLDEPEEGVGAENEDEEEDALSYEMRLIPEDESKIDEIFKALCDCAAMNPDPEEEGEGDFFYNEEEVHAGLDDETRAALVANQTANMDLDALVGDDPSRFEDEEGGEGEDAMDGKQ
eukprot:gene3546-13616_t